MHDKQLHEPVVWAPHHGNGYASSALLDCQRNATAHGSAVEAPQQGKHENTEKHTKCQLQLPTASHRALKCMYCALAAHYLQVPIVNIHPRH
ncbi:hypothetical protein GCM10027081_48920 [Cupriavidus yeoncheonensis]